jgi:hypothetical protein
MKKGFASLLVLIEGLAIGLLIGLALSTQQRLKLLRQIVAVLEPATLAMPDG